MDQWQTELRQALKTTQELNSFFHDTFPETNYPILIPQAIAHKIKAKGIDSPLGLQFLPQVQENLAAGLVDPIADNDHQVTHQLIHRYKSRVLFMPTSRCPIICRYCFRKNELYDDENLFNADLDKTLAYLNEHKEINEIIFSGGDPLTLSDTKLSTYLEKFSRINHIKYIRFHTRFPIIIPARINQGLLELLEKFTRKFKKINMVIHTNHPDEFDTDFFQAVKKLSSIPNLELSSQSVFLKDINDSVKVLKELFTVLSDHNVKPYYIHHPDPAKGTLHYAIDIEKTKKIYQALREQLSGWQIPHYMIEQDSGQGKIWAMGISEIRHF